MQEIINEAGSSLKVIKNTGVSEQKYEAAVKKYFLAKESFSFASLSASKDIANWNTAKLNKDIIPLFEVDLAPELNSVEPTIANKRFKDVKTKDGVKGVTYTHELSPESHAALNSYDQNRTYTRIFRVTSENELLCDIQEDGTVKGEPTSSFIVMNREDATDENPPQTKVQIKFKNYDMNIVKPSFDVAEYEGVYDVHLVLGTVSATSIKFTAKSWGENITNLVAANVVLKDASGSVHASSFVTYDSDTEVYELTGTGFANDFTLNIDGIQVIGTVYYEGATALTLTGI
jgi:hypothetical protein